MDDEEIKKIDSPKISDSSSPENANIEIAVEVDESFKPENMEDTRDEIITGDDSNLFQQPCSSQSGISIEARELMKSISSRHRYRLRDMSETSSDSSSFTTVSSVSYTSRLSSDKIEPTERGMRELRIDSTSDSSIPDSFSEDPKEVIESKDGNGSDGTSLNTAAESVLDKSSYACSSFQPLNEDTVPIGDLDEQSISVFAHTSEGELPIKTMSMRKRLHDSSSSNQSDHSSASETEVRESKRVRKSLEESKPKIGFRKRSKSEPSKRK